MGRRRRELPFLGSSTANVRIKIMVSTLVSFQRNVCGPSCPQRLCASFGQFFCPAKRCRTKSEGQSIGKQAFSLPPADCAHGLPSLCEFSVFSFPRGQLVVANNRPLIQPILLTLPGMEIGAVLCCLVLDPSSISLSGFFPVFHHPSPCPDSLTFFAVLMPDLPSLQGSPTVPLRHGRMRVRGSQKARRQWTAAPAAAHAAHQRPRKAFLATGENKGASTYCKPVPRTSPCGCRKRQWMVLPWEKDSPMRG